MDTAYRLPPVRTIGLAAPFRWLADGWSDLWKAPGPCLVHGLVMAVVSAALVYAIYTTNAAFWALALTFGYVFVAPVLAMGPYEAGRLLEQGQKVSLGRITLVRGALRQDVAYLGLALLMIYFFWGRIAQIVYGLSTWRLYHTAPAFIDFALRTPEGHRMLIVGSLIGGAIGLLTYVLVVVSAPMLLDPRTNVFAAAATSFRAVGENPGAMLLWALIILALVGVAAASGFVLMVVIFPWLGLASWRAYRDLVVEPEAARAQAAA